MLLKNILYRIGILKEGWGSQGIFSNSDNIVIMTPEEFLEKSRKAKEQQRQISLVKEEQRLSLFDILFEAYKKRGTPKQPKEILPGSKDLRGHELTPEELKSFQDILVKRGEGASQRYLDHQAAKKAAKAAGKKVKKSWTKSDPEEQLPPDRPFVHGGTAAAIMGIPISGAETEDEDDEDENEEEPSAPLVPVSHLIKKNQNYLIHMHVNF